ncbi:MULTISPECIES: hypothetical protein [unclassified Sphingomonas]|uniref:hypothetical protein n=1 Tax=unclassified Sphingomonas TaxID=196159 RepID=UPI0017865075|nr:MULTISPECIES: hypothetical protein [unclassified Sphingomonas]MBD8471179.1 hypothetical protein [Sphingomonas sp. CFBP 8765]MDY1006950.1 hypothetical protein [Sphingomonas sp. CFBP9019]
MSEPLIASPLLAELQRLLAAQDVIALMPTPGIDTSVGSMWADPMSAVAIVDMQQQIVELVGGATDEDLIKAYRETDGERECLDAEALLAEIERRNLDK